MRLIICILLLSATSIYGQSFSSPDDFFGQRLGGRFTSHHRVVEYFRHLAVNSQNVRLIEYGQSVEGRPLIMVVLASEKNISRLEEIRSNNLKLAGIEKGVPTADAPAIIWYSYNVHGNEAVSTEASMMTAHAVLQRPELLDKLILIIDPCLNPDGRERYVNFFNSAKGRRPDPSPFSREHIEPWPGGRTNHYYFDLNRDWAWQTQTETQARMQVFNQWLPQVHVDFHEQQIDEPYYFAPAAEPYHEDISSWQREFQRIVGKENASVFDRKGWLYFTRERFDLLYPSYGDTYPIYNGAIGMTYEQGGSGRAGLSVLTRSGDTLTLADRMLHHFTTGMTTLETSSRYSSKLVAEFREYFRRSVSEPLGSYRSYIVKGDNPEKLKALQDLLDRNGIKYGFGARRQASGYNYMTGRHEGFNVLETDLVISASQPKSVLVKVLFEPQTAVSDSATYDITAWSLPYAFGLPAFATSTVINPTTDAPPARPSPAASPGVLAFVTPWRSLANVKFLTDLLKRGVKVRQSEEAFQIAGKRFDAGSLVISQAMNAGMHQNFPRLVHQAAAEHNVEIWPLTSSLAETGADLGSSKMKLITMPRVALILGDNATASAFGEVWHFFDNELDYPLSVIRTANLSSSTLSNYDVAILPDGRYSDPLAETLSKWIQAGGRAIFMGGATSYFAGKAPFELKAKEIRKDTTSVDPYADLRLFKDRETDDIRSSIPGAIYRVDLDTSHPLCFGLGDAYFTMKLDDNLYQFLKAGWNVGVLKKDNYVSGFVGADAKSGLKDGLSFGVQAIGAGTVVYIVDNPLFRGFWENGKILFSNAVFLPLH